jgi:serine protease AprX
VEGTSFAAPLTASVIACMLQANPSMTPALVRQVLLSASKEVGGAPSERQGAGALDAGRAVMLALRETHAPWVGGSIQNTLAGGGRIVLTLHDRNARRAAVYGSWDDWGQPGIRMQQAGPGLWRAEMPPLPPGRHQYKFLLDEMRWTDDPENPRRTPDGAGGHNSILIV